MTDHRNLTADEIFFIFKEEHRLCSPLDHEAEPSFDLQPTSTIDEWTDARDLLPWPELAKVYNDTFKIDISLDTWTEAFEPTDKRTIKNVCDLIAREAKIEIIKPVKVFGQVCLSSAVFKSIKKNLEIRGIDTRNLAPSTKIEPILKKHFGDFIAHINTNYAGVIPDIKARKTSLEKIAAYVFLLFLACLVGGIFWGKFLLLSIPVFVVSVILWYIDRRLFNYRDGMLTIPGIVTFRDLVNKIVETKYASQQSL